MDFFHFFHPQYQGCLCLKSLVCRRGSPRSADWCPSGALDEGVYLEYFAKKPCRTSQKDMFKYVQIMIYLLLLLYMKHHEVIMEHCQSCQ